MAVAGVPPVLICTASLVRRRPGVALVGKSWQRTPTQLQGLPGAGLGMGVQAGGLGGSPLVFLTLFWSQSCPLAPVVSKERPFPGLWRGGCRGWMGLR